MSNEMTLEALRSVPLFASLTDAATIDLRNLLATKNVSAGTQLFHKDDSGDAMYLIESGRVRISITDEDRKEITLAELAQGDFFGEMSIIDGRKRSADATVIEDGRFAVLSRPNFLSFVRANPDVALGMLGAWSDRLRRTAELIRSRVSRNANEEERKRATVADRAADLIAEFGGSWKFIGVSIGLIVFWIVAPIKCPESFPENAVQIFSFSDLFVFSHYDNIRFDQMLFKTSGLTIKSSDHTRMILREHGRDRIPLGRKFKYGKVIIILP